MIRAATLFIATSPTRFRPRPFIWPGRGCAPVYLEALGGIKGAWGVSSAVEHYVDIVVATSSILVPPTIHRPSGQISTGAKTHRELKETAMKVANSLRSLKTRHRDCQVVRRKGRVYVINKTQKRYKARQG